MEHSKREAAVKLAEAGWEILPLRPNGKKPLGRFAPQGYKSATKDVKRVRKIWSRFPEANIGIVTGKVNNLVVMDIDSAEALEWLKDKKTANDNIKAESPNGWHHYYSYEKGTPTITSGKIHPEIDLKSDGGYVVAPPSTIDDGEYKYFPYLDIHETKPAEMPDWLTTLFHSNSRTQTQTCPGAGSGQSGEFPHAEDATDDNTNYVSPLFKWQKGYQVEPLEAPDRGQRNEWTFKTCLTHLNLGLSMRSFRAIFFQKIYPQMNKKGLKEGEINEAIKNAKKYAHGDPQKLPASVRSYYRRKPGNKDRESKNRQVGGQGRQSGRSTGPGPNSPSSWSQAEMRQAITCWLSRRGNRLEYNSRGNRSCIAQLLDDLQRWAQKKKPGKRKPARATLYRVLKKLQERGQLLKKIERSGEGHTKMTLAQGKNMEPSYQTTHSNGVQRGNREKFCARDPKKKGGGRKSRDEPGKIPKRLNQKARNAGLVLTPVERTTLKLLTEASGDADFATWQMKQHTPERIGVVLSEFEKHKENIENPGGWIRRRLETCIIG